MRCISVVNDNWARALNRSLIGNAVVAGVPFGGPVAVCGLALVGQRVAYSY